MKALPSNMHPTCMYLYTTHAKNLFGGAISIDSLLLLLLVLFYEELRWKVIFLAQLSSKNTIIYIYFFYSLLHHLNKTPNVCSYCMHKDFKSWISLWRFLDFSNCSQFDTWSGDHSSSIYNWCGYRKGYYLRSWYTWHI